MKCAIRRIIYIYMLNMHIYGYEIFQNVVVDSRSLDSNNLVNRYEWEKCNCLNFLNRIQK